MISAEAEPEPIGLLGSSVIGYTNRGLGYANTDIGYGSRSIIQSGYRSGLGYNTYGLRNTVNVGYGNYGLGRTINSVYGRLY